MFCSMRRKLLASLLALVVCASSAPLTVKVAAQRRRPVRRTAATGAGLNRLYDARVTQLGDAYLRGYYAFNPTEATAAGLHEFDSKLEERGADAVAAEVRRLRGVLSELARVPEWRLSPDARYDYLVLQSHARAQLLELEDVRMWRRDPNLYHRLAAGPRGRPQISTPRRASTPRRRSRRPPEALTSSSASCRRCSSARAGAA